MTEKELKDHCAETAELALIMMAARMTPCVIEPPVPREGTEWFQCNYRLPRYEATVWRMWRDEAIKALIERAKRLRITHLADMERVHGLASDPEQAFVVVARTAGADDGKVGYSVRVRVGMMGGGMQVSLDMMGRCAT